MRVHRALQADGFGIVVLDAYRPWRVTKTLWDATPADRRTFVADPARGSRHNRGAAVDVTLFDRAGRTRVYSVPAGWTGQGTPSVRTLDLTTLAPQAGFAGSATAIQTAGFEPRAVTDIEVELGSSGALDDLCWDPHPD